jgi:hypothetical protein
MQNQNKTSWIDIIIDFLIKILAKCTPSRIEFKTHKTIAIFKVLLMIIVVLLCIIFVGIVLSIYVSSFLLMILGKILSFGAVADNTHQKSQDRYYEENGRYY